jgi:hypothetical protein
MLFPTWDIAAMIKTFLTPYLPLIRVALGFQLPGSWEGRRDGISSRQDFQRYQSSEKQM